MAPARHGSFRMGATQDRTMVSIVIAAHNAEKFLAVCLESVLWQSHGKVEAIVVDDASSDGTAAIAEATPHG